MMSISIDTSTIIPESTRTTGIEFCDALCRASKSYKFIFSKYFVHRLCDENDKRAGCISIIRICKTDIGAPYFFLMIVILFCRKTYEYQFPRCITKIFPRVGKYLCGSITDTDDIFFRCSIISAGGFDFSVYFESERKRSWIFGRIEKLSINE